LEQGLRRSQERRLALRDNFWGERRRVSGRQRGVNALPHRRRTRDELGFIHKGMAEIGTERSER